MDIYRFVNSKDIRKHLQDIQYEFSSLEAAWLIYQCRDASVEEKHAAWNELIGTMPDCRIEERRRTRPQSSLHAFLKKYMELENRYIHEFMGEIQGTADMSNMIYAYRYEEKYIGDYQPPFYNTVYSSFSNVLSSIKEDALESKDIELGILTGYRIIKMNVNAPCYGWHMYLDSKQRIMRISPDMDINNEDENDIFYGVFDGLWFDFPVPFKRGDIVWDPEHPDGLCGGPFVLDSCGLNGIEQDSTREFLKKDGDNTDMNACGYFLDNESVDPCCGIYHEIMWNYMDLEYYDRKLVQGERVLTALSSHLKGDIDSILFAKAYHSILSEEAAKFSEPRDVTLRGLVLAGLAEEQHIKIWLDDVHKAPEGYKWCRSVNEAMSLIKRSEYKWNAEVIDVIDCDNYLGEYAKDGGNGIKLLEWLAERETFYPVVAHCMDPDAVESMQSYIRRHWGN